MREVTTHKVPGDSRDYIRILPEGDVPKDGASPLYRLRLGVPGEEAVTSILIRFQDGQGPNGATEEALLAVVIDRLQQFQTGKASNRGRAVALTHLETALLWLKGVKAEQIEKDRAQEQKA